MCSICRQNPCDNRCPNAPDEVPVTSCSACGTGIYAGEDFYQVQGTDFCEDCMDGFRREARED